MSDTAKQNFALFFTRGLSLERWNRIGMFEREVALYRLTASTFNTVYFFTYGNKKDLSYTSLLPSNVVIVPKPTYISAVLYSFILPFIHAKKLRTVHLMKTNQMDGSWSAVIAKKLYGAKLIVRCGYEWLQFIEQSKRSWMKRTFAYCVERFAYRNAHKIVVTSGGARDFIVERFAIAPSTISIIPNYVDTDLFTPIQLPKKAKQIITIGRLEPQKNLSALLDAMIGIDATLVVVGEGSQHAVLATFAKLHNLSVVFTGNLSQKDIVTQLNASELFILPSLYEGHPKTLLEAMAVGLPCIGSDIPGINDTIVDSVNGILCGVDSFSIRSTLEKLLGDDALRAKLAEEARKTALEIYSLHAVVKAELALYHSLVS
jgi:glycosyltransferase involved in cell wall biosynthesis